MFLQTGQTFKITEEAKTQYSEYVGMESSTQTKPPETATPSDVDTRVSMLEAELAGLRRDIESALAAQEQLHNRLSLAVEKLSELIRQRNFSNASANSARPPDPDRHLGLQLGRLESRMRNVEQRVERVTGQVTSILESRIWRTLVKGSGFLLKIVK